MVSCPPNGMEVNQCFVTVHGWTKVSLLVLVWRPLLVGRAWESFSSQPTVTDDADDMIGPIIVSLGYMSIYGKVVDTVPVGIYRTGTYTSIEMPMFYTSLNIGQYRKKLFFFFFFLMGVG